MISFLIGCPKLQLIPKGSTGLETLLRTSALRGGATPTDYVVSFMTSQKLRFVFQGVFPYMDLMVGGSETVC